MSPKDNPLKIAETKSLQEYFWNSKIKLSKNMDLNMKNRRLVNPYMKRDWKGSKLMPRIKQLTIFLSISEHEGLNQQVATRQNATQKKGLF
jgi:hypothetical protein